MGKKCNLQRGKEGSSAKHLDTAAYKLKKMQEETAAAEEQKAVAEQAAASVEQRQVHAERKTHQLEDRQKQLQQNTAPLQAAAEILQEYLDGRRKLNKRDLPVITAEAAKLKAENGQLKNGCKSAHATKATCSISIRRQGAKSRHFKATPTFCAR